jgi:hypothetical protein
VSSSVVLLIDLGDRDYPARPLRRFISSESTQTPTPTFVLNQFLEKDTALRRWKVRILVQFSIFILII